MGNLISKSSTKLQVKYGLLQKNTECFICNKKLQSCKIIEKYDVYACKHCLKAYNQYEKSKHKLRKRSQSL